MLYKAIQKSNREIVLSLSPGPAHIDRAWQYCRYANMWRITDDFWDNWELLKNMFWRCELWQDHVKEGCFPDCDMLPLGKVGKGFETGERDCLFTREEQKTMMTLWCMFRSPLMIGAELTKMDDFTLSLLTNKELSGREPDKDSYEFTELWSGEVLHSGKEALTVVVPAHGTKVFSVRQIIKILSRPVFSAIIHSPAGSFKKLFCLINAHGCNVGTQSLVKFLMKYIR